jgi:hypothetical protein
MHPDQEGAGGDGGTGDRRQRAGPRRLQAAGEEVERDRQQRRQVRVAHEGVAEDEGERVEEVGSRPDGAPLPVDAELAAESVEGESAQPGQDHRR